MHAGIVGLIPYRSRAVAFAVREGYTGEACDEGITMRHPIIHGQAHSRHNIRFLAVSVTIGCGIALPDIDECKKKKPCHSNASCTNTPGSYKCNCTEGFQGNGTNCEGSSLWSLIGVKIQT